FLKKMAVNVYATNGSTKNISRTELLAWVNKTMQSQFLKVEELCTGAAYCQFMDMLFPYSISMKRIKFSANQEFEYIHNFKLLQLSFSKMGVKKNVAVERLIKGHYLDNFEFLQWFHKFFNANYKHRPYDALSARDGYFMGVGPSSIAAPMSYR
ncbi:CG15306, partial [Drosophila busckii]